MPSYAFKVGPIAWNVELGPDALRYHGGLAKGAVTLGTVRSFGVADISGAMNGIVTEEQQMLGSMGALLGASRLGQLILVHEPAPGRRKTAYVNLDLGDAQCGALVTALRALAPDRFAGIGPMSLMQKQMGLSRARGFILFAIVLLVVSGVLAYFLWHKG